MANTFIDAGVCLKELCVESAKNAGVYQELKQLGEKMKETKKSGGGKKC